MVVASLRPLHMLIPLPGMFFVVRTVCPDPHPIPPTQLPTHTQLKCQLLRNSFCHHPFMFPYHITFTTFIIIIIYCFLVYDWSLPKLMVSSMRQGSDVFYKLYPGPVHGRIQMFVGLVQLTNYLTQTNEGMVWPVVVPLPNMVGCSLRWKSLSSTLGHTSICFSSWLRKGCF